MSAKRRYKAPDGRTVMTEVTAITSRIGVYQVQTIGNEIQGFYSRVFRPGWSSKVRNTVTFGEAWEKHKELCAATSRLPQ